MSKQTDGWKQVPKSNDPSRFGRDYTHEAGWQIQHCGHPTALWPYLLIDPTGEIILSGANGPLRNPTYGVAWRSVQAAKDYVSTIGKTRKELLSICGWSRQ